MKRMLIALSLIIPSYSCADQDNTEKAIDWIMKSCVSSGSRILVEGEGSGEASLKLKSLEKLGAGVSGSFNLKKEEIEGLTDQLNSLSLENAEKIRDCITPFRERIFIMYLPEEKDNNRGADDKKDNVTNNSPEINKESINSEDKKTTYNDANTTSSEDDKKSDKIEKNRVKSQETTGDKSPIINNTNGSVSINY